MLAPEQFLPGMPGRVSLAKIDAVVSAKLGPTRVRGNARPAAFNRQVAMYLAKHVGGWSTTAIGRFYNGRDHSTVCYSIKRVGSQSERQPSLARLIEELTAAITASTSPIPAHSQSPNVKSPEVYIADLDDATLNALADRLTHKVLQRIAQLHQIAESSR